jgi:hypothetical protein
VNVTVGKVTALRCTRMVDFADFDELVRGGQPSETTRQTWTRRRRPDPSGCLPRSRWWAGNARSRNYRERECAEQLVHELTRTEPLLRRAGVAAAPIPAVSRHNDRTRGRGSGQSSPESRPRRGRILSGGVRRSPHAWPPSRHLNVGRSLTSFATRKRSPSAPNLLPPVSSATTCAPFARLDQQSRGLCIFSAVDVCSAQFSAPVSTTVHRRRDRGICEASQVGRDQSAHPGAVCSRSTHLGAQRCSQIAPHSPMRVLRAAATVGPDLTFLDIRPPDLDG